MFILRISLCCLLLFFRFVFLVFIESWLGFIVYGIYWDFKLSMWYFNVNIGFFMGIKLYFVFLNLGILYYFEGEFWV